jgi:hypothetical protein
MKLFGNPVQPFQFRRVKLIYFPDVVAFFHHFQLPQEDFSPDCLDWHRLGNLQIVCGHGRPLSAEPVRMTGAGGGGNPAPQYSINQGWPGPKSRP